jgi:hypothetical protein
MFSLGCASVAEPTDEQSFDVARVVGASLALRPGGTAYTTEHMTTLAIGALPIGLQRDDAGLIVGSYNGMTYRYAVWCERCGVPGPCSWQSTRATIVGSWTGVIHRPIDAMVTSDGLWQVTRMCKDVAGPPVVTGTAATTLSALIGDARYEVSAQISQKLKVRDRFLPPPPAFAGTVAVDVAATTDDGTFDITAEAAFDYDRHGDLTVDGTRYDLDLATGGVVLPFAGE